MTGRVISSSPRLESLLSAWQSRERTCYFLGKTGGMCDRDSNQDCDPRACAIPGSDQSPNPGGRFLQQHCPQPPLPHLALQVGYHGSILTPSQSQGLAPGFEFAPLFPGDPGQITSSLWASAVSSIKWDGSGIIPQMGVSIRHGRAPL